MDLTTFQNGDSERVLKWVEQVKYVSILFIFCLIFHKLHAKIFHTVESILYQKINGIEGVDFVEKPFQFLKHIEATQFHNHIIAKICHRLCVYLIYYFQM